MVENNQNTKNLTIDLHIKSLCLKVTEHTPIYVVWSRGKDHPFFRSLMITLTILIIGNKKAKTKSRLLNENVSQAVIDEKFQINTVMEVNEDGLPIKEKMVMHLFSQIVELAANTKYYLYSQNLQLEERKGRDLQGMQT